MTASKTSDQAETVTRITEESDGKSWLGHRGLAGELDKRLLTGATEDELSELRKRWLDHVRHLRREHRLDVQQERPGFWRLVGVVGAVPMTQESSHVEETDDDLGQADDYEEPDETAPSAHPEEVPARLGPTARALAVLAEQGLLTDPLLKASVNLLIRQASESNHWHNCAHYRSRKALALIEQQPIRSAAEYQRYCKRNLRHEHVVPNSVIYEMLLSASDLSPSAIESLLSTYCIRATIHLDEDRDLRDRGLASKMPKQFYEDRKRGLTGKPLARYEIAEIIMDKRNGPVWFPGEPQSPIRLQINKAESRVVT